MNLVSEVDEWSEFVQVFRMLLLLSLILVSAVNILSDYQNKNPFIPAEPGHTPKCAKLGTSFCEYVDDYPE